MNNAHIDEFSEGPTDKLDVLEPIKDSRDTTIQALVRLLKRSKDYLVPEAVGLKKDIELALESL